MLLIRANVKIELYRSLFLPFLFLTLETMDDHVFTRHLVNWILEDPEKYQKLFDKNESNLDQVNTAILRISSQLLEYRNQVNIRTIRSVIALDESYWAWKRTRSIFHQGIQSSEIAT